MKDNNTIFDYLMQVMTVFGFSLLVLNLFCIFVGDAAKGYSAMFALGNMAEYLLQQHFSIWLCRLSLSGCAFCSLQMLLSKK